MKKNKNFILVLIAIFILTYALLWAGFNIYHKASKPQISTSNESVKTIGSQIIANGEVRSVNEATLNFQMGGKLVYLPYKAGDQVYSGATIAQLDTYDLQRQLQMALNNYKIQRDTFDQTQANSQNSILQGQQNTALQEAGTPQQANVVNDIISRILDQNQMQLNNSVINVEITNYALQLSTLTSPINGILVREDVNTPNINITPTTSFMVVDPSEYVFKANVDADEINYVKLGNSATITLNGLNKSFTGTVQTIYPNRITTSTGDQVYQIDIYSPSLLSFKPKFQQQGSVSISTSQTNKTDLVPSYLVTANNYLWIMQNNQSKLTQLNTGKTNNNLTEILGGIPSNSKLISSPEDLIKQKYLIQ